jgi:long-chain acyl-CoA synthetase
MFNLDTLVDVVALVAASKRERAVLWQDASTNWHPISSDELVARVYALANAFANWGIVKGDRIALLAENRWEWPVVDFATLVLGAVDVPIYPTLTAEQIAGLLIDSGARIAVVSTEAQYRKVASIRNQTKLERILVMDQIAGLESTLTVIALSSLLENAGAGASGVDMQQWLRSFAVKPQDLATLIYTSGTTGQPKGVMLTHGNIASNLNYSTRAFSWNANSSCISFLPLSHITARHLDYALFCYGATLAYCGNFERLPAALTTIQPTVFVAVPRVYEKIRDEVQRRAGSKPMVKRLFTWALATGRRHREQILLGQTPSSPSWRLADRLVFQKVKQAFGGKVRDFIAGGAPLGVDTAGWFADVGIRIFEGYGLTETSPVLALNNAKDHRIGSVGKPIESVECRFAPDGELLVRGPFVFAGYWQKPEATAEVIEADGWFHTGDIARQDEDGFLYITDRKKELIKTSGGKMIAPQPIESKLNNSQLVANAVVVGDRHKFLSVLIAPNFPALENLARQKGIAFSSRADLVKNPVVQAEYHALVHNLNEGLANFETIKRFHLVPDEWSMDSGELAPTMKLRRRIVVQRYAAEIAAFYHDESTAHR